MSTCKGAPAPHDNCTHGERCDWLGGGIVDAAPHSTSWPCDFGMHGRCASCACQCHRIRAVAIAPDGGE